jgi:hypothetical protein
MRATLIRDHPDVMRTTNIGSRPNDAVYHAETTVLLRAARQNGGMLEGKTVDVFVDRPMCESCKRILPYVGLELGNPTVNFAGRWGKTRTIYGGAWKK